ncbi:hypothetical protein [Microbulbifer halophilus]|uniref:Outer membrane protein beta-barrel domain-containing protein n=1 Tax=Microbulbifer halophilus TaxID=453963 RepID=A0ABW5EG64_9GAMM|nr:hypothetical protein [Microbulbifer halophilus]MCW8128048.1 hypothetical protein [Microbulbifer halophilus]
MKHRAPYRRSIINVAIILAGLSVGAGNADAETVQADGKTWEFYVAPYLWGIALDGDISHKPYSVKVDESFSDLWSDLDAGFMGAFEARRDRFSILVDGFYIDLTDDGEFKDLPLPFPVDLDVDNRTYTALLTATYRVAQSSSGFIDVLAGYRYWSLKTRLKVDTPIEGLQVSEDNSWHDAQFGVRGHVDLTQRLYIEGMALTGARSDRTVDLAAFMGYEMNDCTAIMLGYRHVKIDYSESLYDFDAALRGTAIGFSYRF